MPVAEFSDDQRAIYVLWDKDLKCVGSEPEMERADMLLDRRDAANVDHDQLHLAGPTAIGMYGFSTSTDAEGHVLIDRQTMGLGPIPR